MPLCDGSKEDLKKACEDCFEAFRLGVFVLSELLAEAHLGLDGPLE
jgi:hypothetical protein